MTIPTVKSTSGLVRTIRILKGIVNPLDFIEQRVKKYGDFYQVTFKNAPPTITISNPKAIEDIFTASPNSLVVGQANQILSFLVGDNSLLLLDGKTHQQRRRLLMPAFHGESLSKCSQQIVEIADQVSDRWQPQTTFKVRTGMQEITMRVIFTVIFGSDSGDRYERLRKLLTDLLEIFNTPLTSIFIFFPRLQQDWGKFSPWGRYLRLKAEIKDLIYTEIQERRELLASGEPQQDILGLLLAAQDESGEGMSDEELHDEIITLLFAGHETTASALTWAFYWIHYYPEIKAKLLSELETLPKDFDYQTINNLPYLNAVILETLRIYPIAAGTFFRILTKPMSVMGYDFQPSTALMISIYALHQREDLYPNPRQFDPDRFLTRTYSAYEYIPFGGGNRRCLGSALALLEMKLAIATILPKFDLELISKRPMSPVRRGLTVAPPAGFKMKVNSKN